jgi:hypothetical protein
MFIPCDSLPPSITEGYNEMFTQRVSWDIKGEKGNIITRHRDFPDVPSACSFVKEIKSISLSKPVMDQFTIEKRKGNK